MRALLDELRRVAFPPERKQLYILAGIAGAAVLVAGILGAVLVFGGPTEAQLSEVQKLAESARLAASRAHWVYPSEDEPEETSLLYVTQLRELEGDLDREGEDRAVALSSEFAGTLVRLGDQYWEADGGKIFARDFYAQALMFDPTLDVAKQRSGFLQVELADLRERAKAGEFSEEEIAAATELAELAEPMIDPEAAAPGKAALEERVAKVKHKAKKRRKQRSHSQAGDDDTLVAAAQPPTPPDPSADEAGDAEGDETGGELEGDETGEEDVLAIPPSEMDREQARAAAKALVKEAVALKRKGKREAALKKLYQATRIDRRYAPAWDELRDVHFQIGAYQEAANYGEKAVKNASRNGKYHLRLGEAYWKLKDYAQAEASWKTAQSLGVDQATARLQALRKKLGR
jgi:tetratricopeptide (TPR) repeat protein